MIEKARVLCLASTLLLCTETVADTFYLKPWKEVYGELHPGSEPEWRGMKDAHAWALDEHVRLEPAVLERLRGERAEIPWTDVLPIARLIPTGAIRDVLIGRLKEVLTRYPSRSIDRTSPDARIVASVVRILGEVGDKRISKIAGELVTKDGQPIVCWNSRSRPCATSEMRPVSKNSDRSRYVTKMSTLTASAG